MIRVGFTGTRIGMTAAQSAKVGAILDHVMACRVVVDGPDDGEMDYEEIRGHHGCCEGADLEFGQLCRDRGLLVEGHPGPEGVRPADVHLYAVLHESKNHLARNRDIVRVVRAMIAAPPTALRQARGGTWYTIDYAREAGRPILVVAPDGSIVVNQSDVAWPWSRPK